MFKKEVIYSFSDNVNSYNSKREYIETKKIVLSFGRCKSGQIYMVVDLSEKFSNKGNLEWRKINSWDYYSDVFPELSVDFEIALEASSAWDKTCAGKIFHKICQETIVKDYFPRLYKQMEDLRQN